MKRNLLLSPGPTVVPPSVCEVLSRPIIHHRTPQFQNHLKEAVEGLKYVFQTKNDVYILAASGTGGMEASVCNLVSPGDHVIVVEGGKFGERWTELCEAYGAKATVVKIEWGKSIEAAELKKLLAADKAVKAVFVTLTETSTGVTTDIKSLGEVIKHTDAVLVVDAVSGLGVTDLQTDNWSVDIVVSASHKGLMLPPGLAFVSVSAKAFKLIEQCKSPRYYFDLKKCKEAMADVDTPFTPAIGLVIALNESIRLIKEAGLQNLFAHYDRLAKGTRAAVKALGLTLLPEEKCMSNVVTTINMPEGIDAGKVVKTMRDTHGVTIVAGQGHLKSKIVRMAHMGVLDEYDIIAGISCFEKVLHKMGYKFTLGAGVAAAQKFFNS